MQEGSLLLDVLGCKGDPEGLMWDMIGNIDQYEKIGVQLIPFDYWPNIHEVFWASRHGCGNVSKPSCPLALSVRARKPELPDNQVCQAACGSAICKTGY